MIPQIKILHTLDEYSRRLGLLNEERMQAAVRTLNRTMTTVRAEGAREMAGIYPGLKIRTIKAQMKFARATRGRPEAVITFSGKRFRLFGNWPLTKTVTAKGVRTRLRGFGSARAGVALPRLPFRVETGDGVAVSAAELRQAFIQRAASSGVPNVFIRTGRGRYPISVLVAPSLAAAFVEKGIGDALSRSARMRFETVFVQEAKFRLSKRGA